MNIVIVGAGEVGTSVARHLAIEGHDVTVVDKSQAKINKVREALDVMSYIGSGSSIRVLRDVNAGSADLFIAVSNSDEVNLLAALIAKQLGVKTAVARTSDPDAVDATRGFSNDVLGIDLVVCPEILTAVELTQILKSRGAVAIERFAQNRVEMIQLAVTADSAPTKRALKDLRLPRGALIAAVLREDRLMIPSGDDTLQAQDEAFVIGRTDVTKRIEGLFGKKRRSGKQRAMLVGATQLTRNVVRSLKAEHIQVTVIDEDPEACQSFAEQVEVNVVCGDATDAELLREEGIEHMDMFVALTREDELNLLSTLLAKQLQVRRVAALVQKTEYAPIYRKLGVDATICPWLLVANQILRYVRPSELVSVSLLEGGRGEVLEFRAQLRSRLVGKTLKRIDFPRGALVAAVLRGNEAFVPSGDDTIEAEDLVVVFALPEVRDRVFFLFGERHWFIG